MSSDLALASGLRASRSTASAPAQCVDGVVHVSVLAPDATAARQSYRLRESRCARDGHLVLVQGVDARATQWADFLEAFLGTRSSGDAR